MWCIWYELKHTHEYKARERDFHNMSGINFISINLIEELIRFEWHTKMCVLFYFPFMMDLNKILHETRRLVFYACILIIKKKYGNNIFHPYAFVNGNNDNNMCFFGKCM